ncbi:MAG: lysylphosphatidylglycerol synthase domain-containing protein [Polyangiaceae bacterium]|nr:lysylphosphatidylglycerol synthase domain-containing protein [Polyangiaceae bacterium]
MPYVIAAAVIAFISRQYSLRSIWAEMAKGQALPLVPLALATYFASLAWVAAADRTVLRGLLPEELTPTYFAVAKGKAAAVVLHIVHYALGQGIYATWVARRTRLNVGQAGGLIFYIILGELGSVCLYAALVIGIGRPAVPGSVLPVVLGVALAVIAAVVLLPATRSERFGFLQIWVKVGRKRGLAQLAIRVCQHATTTSATWLAARWFGLDIPLGVMLSYMPVILVVASLPINVAGFGAVQGAWLLLSPWAPPERVLAFSVVWQAVSALALLVRGLPFLRGVLADIREGKGQAGVPATVNQ